ncbi:MAG: hypothetical protein JWP91_2109 [Fibrobacteres bacterium]|nr:hypothetical protein [Fibrobacterota bacterium]
MYALFRNHFPFIPRERSGLNGFPIALFIFMAGLGSGTAAIKTWVGGNGPGGANGWATGANWSPSGAPAATDTLVFDGTTANDCLVNSPVVTANKITMTGYTHVFDLNTRTLAIAGTLGDFRTSGTFSFTTGKISFTGTAAQTFIPHASLTMPPIEQNGTGGTTIATNALITSSLTMANLASNGAFNLGSGFVHSVTATLTLNANGNLDFGSSTLAFGGTAANFSALTTLTPGTGTLRFNATSGTQVFTPKSGGTHPNITHTAAGILQLATNGLTCLSYSNSAGILDFNGMNVTTTTGDFTVTNGTSTTFTNLAGRTITVGANATLTGQSGNLLNLNPGATGWTLTGTASSTVAANYAAISYGTVNPSNIIGSTANCTDGGNNVRWAFLSAYTWTGLGADYNWSTTGNWSGAAVPNSLSQVTFDGTSTKKCILDVDATVYSIQFTSGYSSSDANTGKFDFSTHTLSVATGAADFTMGSSASIVPGTGTLAFTNTDGAATQSFTPRAGATFPALSKSGAGTLTRATNALTAGALTVTGGALGWGSGSLTNAVASISVSGGASMDFGAQTVQVTSGNADLSGVGTLVAGTGTLEFTGTGGTQVFTPKASATHPYIVHSGASTLQLATNDLTAAGFSQSAGILSFNGRNVAATADFVVTNGTTTSLTGLGGRTITVGGNATFTGQAGNLLNLNPGVSGWTLTGGASSVVTATFANISYGTVNPSTIAGIATSCTNGGNNVRWTFIVPVVWDGGGADGTCGGAAGDGNKWSCAANWDGNVVPTGTDTVVFNATSTKNCKLDASVAVNGISFSSGYTGTFDFQSYTMTVSATGDFRTGGAITPGTGKISFNGSAAQRLIPPGIQANSILPTIEQNGTGGTTVTTNRLRTATLVLANLSGNGAFNLGSGLQDTVTTDLTMNANGNLDFGSSTLNYTGATMDFRNLTTLTAGSGTIAFMGGSGVNTTLIPKTGMTLPAISKFNANTVTLSTNGLTAGTFTMTGGNWNWGNGLSHSITSISGSANPTMLFGSSTVAVNSGNADFTGMNVTANTGTLSFTGTSGTQILKPKSGQTHPTIAHPGASTLQLATNALICLSFTHSGGTFDFNSLNVTTSGNFTVTNGTSATFTNLGGRTLTVSGNVNLAGTALSPLNLNPGSIWNLTVTGTLAASRATVGNGNAAGAASPGAATLSENVGGNTNWTFSGLDYTPFNYSTIININTTSTGANITSNLTNFPLLVRLDSNNFFFSQAQPDGRDIRFSDPDGTSLPYEIERWDAANKKAELWVKVPQIDGNSNGDFIILYWGNANALPTASASGVFGSYRSVLHLQQSPGASAPQFTDASGNADNGTAQSGATGDSATGLSGMGYRLPGGTSKYISTATSFVNPTTFTLSLWLKTTSMVGGRYFGFASSQTGVSVSNDRVIWMDNTGKLSFGVYPGVSKVLTSASAYNDGRWHRVTARLSTAGQFLYVDGVQVGSDATVTTGESYTGYWRVGYDGMAWSPAPTNTNPVAVVDEAEVIHSALSADWIKLEYETQKENTGNIISFANSALSNWAYSTKVYVNTSPSGAYIAADVANFPMLVRLTNANFNFAQAKSDGGDLRFADSAGTMLPYEIERYDATNKVAEAWVLLPTVRANNNSQWFRMYWGRSFASSLSSAGSVFAASNNFAGVYHLGEDGNTTASGYRDATTLGNHATGVAMTNATDVTGDIGLGQNMNGSTQGINAGGGSTGSTLHPTTAFTLEAWVKATAKSANDKVISKSYSANSSPFIEYELALNGAGTLYQVGVTTGGAATYATGTTVTATGSWYHLAGTYDGATLKFYLNGVLETSAAKTGVLNDYTQPMYLGTNQWAAAEALNGILDEARISNAARSIDWIRLSYETQKATATAVQVGPRTPDFARSVRFNFNTTATGANVTATDVANIPILFRLNSANFDFSAATNAGTDIQFVDKDGTFLYHEVVEWDKANKVGKVWAKIPQVDKNVTTDYVTLYYGCATCASSPYAVSDSVWSAYRGVWHMNGSNENQAKDVTRYRNHLTYNNDVPMGAGLTAPQSPYFSANCAKVADPAGGDLDLGTGDLTVMGWFKTSVASETGVYRVLAGKTNPSVTPRYGYGLVTVAAGVVDSGKVFFEIFSNGTQKATPFSTSRVNDGVWHFISGKRATNILESYVDGVSMGTVSAAGATIDNPESFVVAGTTDESATNFYIGNVGDVSVSATAFSADYIKMSYQNQKAADALLSTPITAASFQKSKVFKLNTTASGANVSGDVYNFPLLLRISDVNGGLVDLVQNGGTDIRFLDGDGVTWLDYQVERWDKTADSAEVWVKVPKVIGNYAGQTITMYYQQVSATVPDGQCATCVFNTSSGFAGAWHLDEDGNNTASGYLDASNGLHHATGTSMLTTSDVAGIVNLSQDFDGTADYLTVTDHADFDPERGITLELWARPDDLGGASRGLFSKGRDNATSGYWSGLWRSVDATGKWRVQYGASVVNSVTTAAQTTWAHLGLSLIQGGRWYLYVNGTVTDSGTSAAGEPKNGTENVAIARALGISEFFDGRLDEVRWSKVIRTPDWIKLDYQNQRRDLAPLFNPSPADFQKTRKYTFNTTRTGANVMDSVTNFPLLVRISDVNGGMVDLAQNNAPDIRFLDGDGKTWLNYQIERWDKTADSAEVWVLVPKVDGNSDHDFITLYYQQASGATVADGQCASCVFSASNGYLAAWHLSQAGNNTADNYADASGNAKHGTGVNMAAGSQVSALGAKGQVFNGSTQYINVPTSTNNVAINNQSFTLSGWLNRASINTADYLIGQGPSTLDNGMHFGYRSTNYFTLGFYGDDLDAVAANTTTGAWQYWVATFDVSSKAQKLYYNGDFNNSKTSAGNYTGTGDVYLGKNTWGIDYFDGTLDEIHISTVVRDSNWIKLEYQTQRSSGNVFWNARPGPNNLATLTATAGSGSIALAWNTPVSDSSNADSVGLWVKYTGYPDSATAAATTRVVTLGKTDSAYAYPATYPGTYYFALAVRNTSGAWSPFTKSSSDTANQGGPFMPDTVYADSATGSNANTCTQARNPATPMQTITYALTCGAGAVDTLVVRAMPGTYAGVDTAFAMTGSKPSVVASFDNLSRAVLSSHGTVSEGVTRNFTIALNSGITLRRMDVKCAVNGYLGVYLLAAAGNNVVDGCRIYNKDASTKHATGIYTWSDNVDNVLICNNLILAPATYGIQADNNNAFAIINNTLIGPGTAGSKGFYIDESATDITTVTITDNIFQNWDYGIHTLDSDNDIGKVDNNLFHLVTTNREVVQETDANKILKDPMFATTNLASPHAYKLLPGSPAINSGTSAVNTSAWSLGPSADLYGSARTIGSARDIGLYEGAGFVANPTGEFDTLSTSATATTLTVKNSKWKIIFDQARGGGINFLSDMADSATNLLASGSLLFDAKFDAYAASAQTGNSIAPVFVERNRTRALVRQRLAVSASLELNIYYAVYASGHIYIQSELANLSIAAASVGTVDYTLKLGTALTAGNSGGGPSGFGYLTTSTRDALLAITQDLNGGAAGTETWTASSASGPGGTVVFNTANLDDPAKNMKRQHHFLLYIGDQALDYNKAAGIGNDAYNPTPLSVSSGSLLHERSWQDALSCLWTLDDGGGTVARDKSVYNSLNATVSGSGMVWTAGKVGGALHLTTADVAVVADAAALEASMNGTYMFWIKPDFTNMGSTAFILSKGTTASDGWYFRRSGSTITFNMGPASVTSPALVDGAWTHIAATLNGAYIYLYVNGVLTAVSSISPIATANASNLRFGENAGGGTVDRFQGDLDDIRIYYNELPVSRIQSICNRGFSKVHGHYHVRVDNNNRFVALLNDGAAQTRVQPAFLVDNWYGTKTPKFVYLNGTRLVPNVDYTSDSISLDINGSQLVIQLNKVLTGADQTLFIDDDDSSGFMGEAEKMKTLTISATANDKIAIKNFADTVFGSASTRQWYLELDLNGWTTPTANPATNGFGDFNVWKAAAINPNLAITGGTNQVGLYDLYGRSLSAFQMDYDGISTYFNAGGYGYAAPANISYTLTDSSSTRLSLALSAMTYTGNGSVTMVKRWTVYPTGRIFGSFQITSSNLNFRQTSLWFQGRYNSGSPTTTWSTTTAAATARYGLMGGDLGFHSMVGGILSIKSAGATVTAPGSLVSSASPYSNGTANNDYYEAGLYLQTGLFQAADPPITMNFAMDISKDFTDSATADSLMKDIQTPAVITAITGTRTTTDALDFNADNFAEGDGAYTYAAAGGIAHFRFANTVTAFNPAFRISTWSQGTLPEVVILDNQILTKGYGYNIYLNTAGAGGGELVMQFNRTLAPGTHVIFINHRTGLAVTLRSFEAKDGEGVDTLEWSTESEFENLGYHVYRRVAPGEAQIDGSLAEGGKVAGAGIANALIDAARSRVAAKAASKLAKARAKAAGRPDGSADTTAVDTLASMNLTPEELAVLGYVRITPKMIPGAKGGSSASTMDYRYVDRSAAFGTAYEYLLEASDFHGSKVQYGPRLARPSSSLVTELQSNYPNPFNPITTLRFSLKEKLKVSLILYDSKGRMVRTLVRPQKPMSAGKYRLIWDARNESGFEVPSGQYYYRFTAGRYVKTRKMILVK